MQKASTEQNFIKVPSRDMLYAAQSLIAVSSIQQACADQYADNGVLSLGAIIHCSNVVDNVIERLGLAELANEQSELPF